MVYFSATTEQLPKLDIAGQAHADRVMAFLTDLIARNNGFIGFDQYMEAVLYAPGLGYYSAGSRKFGQYGDYVTAPLISPLFSKVLARYVARCMKPGDAVLELGAGTGIMAADILVETASLKKAMPRYHILEPAADLRRRQLQTLQEVTPELVEQVHWLERLPPDNAFSGVIIGNEVIDAMPCKRFILQAQQALEIGVGLRDGQLCWCTANVETGFQESVLSRLPLPPDCYPDNYISEYRQTTTAWLSALYQYMASGVMVIFDYGYDRSAYYAPSRSDGTLRGYYRHYMLDDPFFYPGMVDLTVSVDFTDLAEAAVSAGFVVSGYTSQANFLIDNGILDLAVQQPVASTNRDRISQAEAIKRLTDPGEMGENIKVMILSKCRDIDAGIGRDQRYCL